MNRAPIINVCHSSALRQSSPGTFRKKMEPEEVEVTFSGPRRSFIFLNEKKLEAHVIFFNAHEGVVHKTLARSSIIFSGRPLCGKYSTVAGGNSIGRKEIILVYWFVVS